MSFNQTLGKLQVSTFACESRGLVGLVTTLWPGIPPLDYKWPSLLGLGFTCSPVSPSKFSPRLCIQVQWTFSITPQPKINPILSSLSSMTTYLSSALGMTNGWMINKLIYQQMNWHHFYTILIRNYTRFASHSIALSVLAFSTLSHGLMPKTTWFNYNFKINCILIFVIIWVLRLSTQSLKQCFANGVSHRCCHKTSFCLHPFKLFAMSLLFRNVLREDSPHARMYKFISQRRDALGRRQL